MLPVPKKGENIATNISISKPKTGKQLTTRNNGFTDHFCSGRDLSPADEILVSKDWCLYFVIWLDCSG
jgi:hypothetical protein